MGMTSCDKSDPRRITKADAATAKNYLTEDEMKDLGLLVEQYVEIFKLGADYWTKVCNDLSKENMLPYGDVAFIGSIAEHIKRNSLPSAAQCKRLVKIVEKAEDKGYIMP